jgi:signal transduction histidine kinase/integral membrane sensor domain MASE1/ActR/RegA family two-component response regulator
MADPGRYPKLPDLGVIVIVAGLYVLAAKLGLSLAFLNASVSPVWPPTGIAIALGLWWGYRVAPGVLLGALLANYFLTDVSFAAVAGISVGNTLEAVTAVYLVRRFIGSRNPFQRAADVLKFVVFAAILSTAVSATIGNVSLCLTGAASWNSFGRLCLTWWAGDGVSALVVTPLILTWIGRNNLVQWRGWRLGEAVLLLILTGVLSATVYTNLLPDAANPRPWGHVTIPLLLWAAFRFGPRGVATAIAIVSVIAIWGTSHGYGPFASLGPNESLLFLQAYIANFGITTLSLAAIVTERKQAERQLSGSLSVTRILAESPALADALPRMLQRICKTFGWEVGAMWMVDEDAGRLSCLKVWPSQGSIGPAVSKFETMTREYKFAPGEGLPGRVWKALEPAWIPDVTKDNNFPRGEVAAAEGLHAAFAFPIHSGEEFLGVMEFFSHEIREPDRALLATFSGIGSQIGQFLQRKQIEEEREQLFAGEKAARNDAEEANRIKDEFLATLSHELRTPLTAMLGWLKMLRGDRLDKETTAHALETVERNARAQAQLIEDLVDVSRIAGGKLSLEIRAVDLLPLVAAAIDIVRPAANARGIQLEVSAEASLGPVLGDPARLQQVVWNLLSNAVKFTSRDGWVYVSLRRCESSAELVVRDTGMGIDPEFLPRVFDRFRQAESTVTRAHRGLGLGLAIVRHLTELHGGTVAAESPGEGLGATFTIKIPLAAMQSAASRDSEQFEETAAGAPRAPLEGVRVLLIEDEPDTRELLSVTLEASGAEVSAVESAQAALNNLNVFKPDVLLSDIGLPNESGYDLIRKVRALSSGMRNVPAVALTAFATAKDRDLALSAGFQVHLAKPVEPEVLIAAIERLANSARQLERS